MSVAGSSWGSDIHLISRVLAFVRLPRNGYHRFCYLTVVIWVLFTVGYAVIRQ